MIYVLSRLSLLSQLSLWPLHVITRVRPSGLRLMDKSEVGRSVGRPAFVRSSNKSRLLLLSVPPPLFVSSSFSLPPSFLLLPFIHYIPKSYNAEWTLSLLPLFSSGSSEGSLRCTIINFTDPRSHDQLSMLWQIPVGILSMVL